MENQSSVIDGQSWDVSRQMWDVDCGSWDVDHWSFLLLICKNEIRWKSPILVSFGMVSKIKIVCKLNFTNFGTTHVSIGHMSPEKLQKRCHKNTPCSTLSFSFAHPAPLFVPHWQNWNSKKKLAFFGTGLLNKKVCKFHCKNFGMQNASIALMSPEKLPKTCPKNTPCSTLHTLLHFFAPHFQNQKSQKIGIFLRFLAWVH